MNALLRYALVKSWRDHLLYGLLVSPTVITCAPLLGIAMFDAVRGHGAFPLRGSATSPAAAAALLGICNVVISAIVAAVGAFTIFRSEVANRSVGLFLLARHPRAVSMASTVYGFFAGVSSYVVARSVIALLTRSQPPDTRPELLIAVIAAVAGSALGSALVAISPEMIVLVPAYAGSVIVAAFLLRSPNLVWIGGVLATAALLVTFTPILLRRRCAA